MFSRQDSFTLEKYVEKLAQLDQRTGLGPMSKSKVKPFDAQVRPTLCGTHVGHSTVTTTFGPEGVAITDRF